MPRYPPQEKRIMATRTSATAKRRPASKAKRRVVTGKDAVGTRTAGAARKPTRKNAVAKKRAVSKAPVKKTARKTVAKKRPAKKAVRKAPRKLTTAQAAAKIQALLEAKHERERIPPPWADTVPHTAGADDNGDAFHAHEAPPDVTHSPAGTSTQIIQPKRGQRS
jgi:hypothetical protein